MWELLLLKIEKVLKENPFLTIIDVLKCTRVIYIYMRIYFEKVFNAIQVPNTILKI